LDHSLEFRAVRDAIIDELADDERRRLVTLLGCMTEPVSELPAGLARVLGAIASLPPPDRARLVRWCGRYLTRWGQIPVAAGRRVTPPPGRARH
jgi:hypothetical protein